MVHEDAGGGEDVLQHGFGSQAACKGEVGVDIDCGGDDSDGLEVQQYVHGVQTVCWAELVLDIHVDNETF